MRWSEIGSQACSVARSLSVVGDRWSLLILRECFLGTRRFADFHDHLAASKNLVSDRLSKLVDEGVLERRVYQEAPVRHEYVLTEKGRDLQPVMLALVAWGDRWMDEGEGPPVENVHKDCGKAMHMVPACSECGEPLHIHNVKPRKGPGFPEDAER